MGSDVECDAAASMEPLERSSWFTADSVDVVSEPGGRLPLAVIDGVSWTAGQPTFEDGETVVVSMTPDHIDTALDVGATFATTGPVPIVVQAFHVSEDRVVVIDPTCSTAQSVLDGAQAELGVSGAELLELLTSENGRATILAASG